MIQIAKARSDVQDVARRWPETEAVIRRLAAEGDTLEAAKEAAKFSAALGVLTIRLGTVAEVGADMVLIVLAAQMANEAFALATDLGREAGAPEAWQ